MKTDRLWVKVMLAALVVLTFAWSAFGQETPTVGDLLEQLVAAQGRIAAGEVEAGMNALAPIRAALQEELPSRWGFVVKLAEVVTAEKAGKIEEAEAGLRGMRAETTESDQLVSAFAVAGRLIEAFTKAGQQRKAVELVGYLSQGGIQQSTYVAPHLELSRLWLSVGNPQKAETTLIACASLAKSEENREKWAGWAWSVVRAGGTVEATVAAYGRLESSAKSINADETLVRRFLDLARQDVTSTYNEELVADGLVLFGAFEERASKMPGVVGDLEAVRKVLSVHKLLEEDDLADAHQALQQAYQSAGGDTGQLQAVQRQGSQLFYKAVRAKDKSRAEDLVKFLAKKDLREASGRESADQWRVWTGQVQSLLGLSTSSDEVLGVYGRLLLLPDTEDARERFLKEFLIKARSELGARWNGSGIPEGIGMHEALSRPAAGMPGLAEEVKLAEHLISALRAAAAGKHEEAMDALEKAFDVAKGTSTNVRHVHNVSHYLLRQAAAAKDPGSAEPLLGFLAQKDFRETSGKKDVRGQWKAWAAKVDVVADIYRSPEDLTVLRERLLAVSESDEAREEVSRRFLLKARRLMGMHYDAGAVAQGVALFDVLRPQVEAEAALAEDLRLTEEMALAYRLAEASKDAEALGALERAYDRAKGNEGEVRRVYEEACYVLRRSIAETDQEAARGVIEFLENGPGKDIPQRQHYGWLTVYLTSLGEVARAEETLRRMASFNKTDSEWMDWGRRLHSLVDRTGSAEEGLALCDRLAPSAEDQAGRRTLQLTRVRFAIEKCKPKVAEEALGELVDSLSVKEPDVDVLAQMHGLADLYGRLGQFDEAYRLFGKAEASAESLPDAQRAGLRRRAFYRGRRANKILSRLLVRYMTDRGTVPPSLVTAYCEASASAGEGEEAIKELAEMEADPSVYMLLAGYLRSYGNIKQARQALGSIPKEALRNDPATAKAVAGFWPSRVDRVSREIERCRGLIEVFEGRAQRASEAGSRAAAEQYRKRSQELRDRIAALEREKGQ